MDTGKDQMMNKMFCEHCKKIIEANSFQKDDLCDDCFWHFHCECGQKLEDSYGSTGDGFCVRCR